MSTGTKRNSIDVYGAQGKTNLLQFDPDKLVLVEDKGHPLYDPRVKDPIDHALVASIKMKGVIEPIIFWKDPESGDVCVVDGRGRVRCAREANRQLREEGQVPKTVPGILGKGDAKSAMGLMVLANEGRREPTAMGRADMAVRLMEAGYSEDQVAILLHCSRPALVNYIALSNATGALKTAVREGKVSATLAYPLATKSPEEQRSTLAKMLEAAGDAKGKRSRGKKMRAANGQKNLRGKRDIEAFRNDVLPGLTAAEQRVAVAMLGWFLGEDFEVESKKSKVA
jgi:ParB family chromosome partitioning protein